MSRRAGAVAEDRALALLRSRGLELVERNFDCRVGELDLVMRAADDTVVVVEVRQRAADDPVGPLESLSPSKLSRIVRATETLLLARPELAEHPVRFDVVAISGDAHDGALDWTPDAFRP